MMTLDQANQLPAHDDLLYLVTFLDVIRESPLAFSIVVFVNAKGGFVSREELVRHIKELDLEILRGKSVGSEVHVCLQELQDTDLVYATMEDCTLRLAGQILIGAILNTHRVHMLEEKYLAGQRVHSD